MRTRRFHPWLHELVLIAGNGARSLCRSWPSSLLHAAGWIALGLLLLLGLAQVNGDRFGLVLRLLGEQAVITGLVFAGFGFAMTRGAVLALSQQLREGCWGAMPVPQPATRRTLRLAASVFAVCAALMVLALLCMVAITAAHWYEWFSRCATIMPIGLLTGAVAGYFAASKTHDDPRPRRVAIGSGAPLYPLPGTNDPQLQFLAEWQRREMLRGWRSGGRLAQLAALALLVPANQAFWSLLGLLLLGISLIWFGLAMRAAQDVIVRATALYAALPMRFERFAAASLRYPLCALVGASAVGALSLLLQGAATGFVLLYPALLASLAAISLLQCWRYRRKPWVARARTPAEILLLGSLAQWFGALVMPILAALLLRHFHVARMNR